MAQEKADPKVPIHFFYRVQLFLFVAKFLSKCEKFSANSNNDNNNKVDEVCGISQ